MKEVIYYSPYIHQCFVNSVSFYLNLSISRRFFYPILVWVLRSAIPRTQDARIFYIDILLSQEKVNHLVINTEVGHSWCVSAPPILFIICLSFFCGMHNWYTSIFVAIIMEFVCHYQLEDTSDLEYISVQPFFLIDLQCCYKKPYHIAERMKKKFFFIMIAYNFDVWVEEILFLQSADNSKESFGRFKFLIRSLSSSWVERSGRVESPSNSLSSTSL